MGAGNIKLLITSGPKYDMLVNDRLGKVLKLLSFIINIRFLRILAYQLRATIVTSPAAVL